MSLQFEQWQRALALMDTAVNLSTAERETWLTRTCAEEPAVAPLLKKLLSAHQRVETKDLLATLPRLQRRPPTKTTGTAGLQVGPFVLVDVLGHGGMGSVWRARYQDDRMKREVAVKLPATLDNPVALASLRERFARERDFLAQLTHPNIARLYDTGVSEAGQPFLAMEYVEGAPIDLYCGYKRLTIKARLTLFLQVLDAVDYAHRQLVLHRDLKPANVLIDTTGQARLLDFGVAKLLPKDAASDADNDELTQEAGAAITLAYAAPEQINNGPLSTATDVYALGVMLYKLLTDLSPYQPKRDTRGALEDEVISAVPALASTRALSTDALNERQLSAAALRRALAGDLDTILAKSLKKNAEERYPTVAAFADDVRRHLAQEPIGARPDSVWYRANRLVARHRLATAASVLAVTALIGTTGIAVWQAGVANANAARAAKESARLVTAQKFLAGVFAGADPEQTKGANVSARDILDRGRDTAEKELASDPEALALVLAQIGDIYFRLGLPDQYLAIQKRRVAVLEAQPGADVNALVDAQLTLGKALGDSGEGSDAVEAMKILNATHATAVARGASPEKIVWALSLIADQHRVNRQMPQARSFADQAVVLAERALPNPHRLLSEVYAVDATVYRVEGKIDQARRQFAKAIAIDETGRGRGAFDQSMTQVSLALLDFDAGDYLAAMNRAVATNKFVLANLGDVKFNLAVTRRIAVLAAERAGNIQLAKQYADELLPVELASSQPQRVALAHLARARVALSKGDLAVAEDELELAGPNLEKSLFRASRIAVLRAELMVRQGNPTLAIEILMPIVAQQVAQYGHNSAELAPTLEWLGVAEAQLGKPDAAARFANSCRLLALVNAETHPARVRCEGYRLLLASDIPYTAKITALDVLETRLTSTRKDQIALLPSLRGARMWFESNRQHRFDPAQFPILN
jgi:eukaryotic-like serine/threonine-protein kinase